MSFRNLAIAAIAIASLSACSGNNKSQTFAPGAAQEGTSSEVGAFEAKGADAYSFSVDQGQIMIDNSNVDAIDEAALEGYPTLMSHSKAIGSLDKAVETDANELKLYSGDTLVMALDTRADAQRILWSKDASFTDESARVTYTRSDAGQDQAPLNGEVTFVLNECRVAQEEKQQDQGKVEEKEQGQEQDQGKVEEKQAQEQAKLAGFLGSEEQGQEKEQGQEQDQGKVEEKGSPAPECKAVSIKLNLRQIVEEKKQEQEQGKVEEKQQEQQQDQGKVEEKQEEKQQDQGKVEEKKEEEKQQDQAKEEDKSQEQEQAQGQEKR